MSGALDKLIGLARVAMEDATTRGGPGWQAAMERALVTAHTAAFITATAERLGVPPNSDLISAKRLSRAERADIQAAVARQLIYLKGFAAARPDLSEAAVLARARLYAASIRSFYYAQRWGAWEIPDRLLPGLQQCLGNCRCQLSDVRDNGDGTGVLTRVLGGEQHCDQCPPLAGDHPVRRKAA